MAIVLVTGTVAISSSSSSSFMTANAQAQPYYGVDNNYEKSKDSSSKSISLNKIKCINDNININGGNAGNISIGNKGQGYLGAYSSNGGYDGKGYYNDGYDNKKDKGFDCIINNNNTNTNFETIPPEPSKATLNVTKLVTCQENINGLMGISIQQIPGACDILENLITEDQYLFQVTDDNPIPSQFPGSESGTVVTLGPGNYVVTETPNSTSINQDITTVLQIPGVESVSIDPPVFTGDCTEVFPGNRATGTIGAGESQTCNIVNNFVVNIE